MTFIRKNLIVQIKIEFILVVFSISLFQNIYAQENIFSIDGYFEAYFPITPTRADSSTTANGKFGTYNWFDEDNFLMFVAKYGISKDDKHKPEHFSDYLNSMLEMSYKQKNGKFLKRKIIKHNFIDAIIYVVQYDGKFGTEKLYGIVSGYYDGNKRIFIWAIVETEGLSKLKAEEIFNEKVKYFKVLK
ncbi:MAG: hypothetical protein MUF28_15725 [Ignavibacterium sp.]|jgi:hypothetical protein|nr:hypothetical protein [Ignavibacterium sp.]